MLFEHFIFYWNYLIDQQHCDSAYSVIINYSHLNTRISIEVLLFQTMKILLYLPLLLKVLNEILLYSTWIKLYYSIFISYPSRGLIVGTQSSLIIVAILRRRLSFVGLSYVTEGNFEERNIIREALVNTLLVRRSECTHSGVFNAPCTLLSLYPPPTQL